MRVIEEGAISDVSVEMGTACYAGLGFRAHMHEVSPLPFFAGRSGVFEAHVPPHFPTMRAAIKYLGANLATHATHDRKCN
jgi:hypothetical protein